MDHVYRLDQRGSVQVVGSLDLGLWFKELVVEQSDSDPMDLVFLTRLLCDFLVSISLSVVRRFLH